MENKSIINKNPLITTGFIVKSDLIKIFYSNSNISNILKNYALFQIRNGKLEEEELERLNKTLNIQWALDIKHSLGEN